MDILGAAANLATQPLRAYLSSLLREQLKQYLDDGAQLEALGVFGGEIVLQKVELRLDALKKLVPVPPGFAITRGFVRELRIIIPWTALFSQAISIRLDTVECVLETSSKDTNASNSSFSQSTASVAQNGGGVIDSATNSNDGGGGLPEWLQSRVTKVLSNITLSVSNLVFRYVHESIAVVMGLRSLDVVSADPHAAWAPAFVDPEGVQKISYKVLSIKDLTITMDDNPVNIAPKQEKNVNHLDPVDEIIQRSYIEEPILSRTNIILRARVMLEPNATDTVKDGGSDENNSSFDGNSSSENKQAISILSTSSSSSSSSSTVSGYEQPSFESLLCAGLGCPGSLNDKRRSREVLDPFSTDVLTSFPGEINQVVVDRNNKVVAPLTTMATLLHVFVDSLELGLSARQAALLERLTQRLEGIDENKQADSKSLSRNGNNNEDIHYVKSSSEKKLKKVEEKEEMATTITSTSDSKNDESQGLIGWLWGSLTGTTDEEIIQAPIETSLHLLDESNQQGSPSRKSNRGGGGEEAAAGRGGGAGVGGHSVIVRPRVILANAHVGRISLVLYRHEAKKKLREEDVSSSSIPASPGATSASYLLSSKDAVKSPSSSLRVPVANKGFVSIDTLFNQSTAPNSPGINTTPWRSGGSNRTQQHVPVPFLRITCDSSWAQVRVLEEPCLDPLRNNANSPSTMVVDGYLDIGSLQASPWDLSLEERFVNSRSRQRSRQARVFDIFDASTASNPAKDDASVTRESIRLVSSLESVKSVTIAAPHTPAKSINSNNSVKSQPFFVWGRPGELALVSNSNSPGTQLHRHPYFECSLFPDVDVDVLAGGANASADQVIDLPSAYSVLPLASSRSGGGGGGVTTSTNSLNEHPLSTRAHFSFISYRNHQDEREEEDGSGSNRHPNPLVCVELICSEITFRADAAIVSGLTLFASSQSSFRKGERMQTYAYKKLPLPSSSPPPLTQSIARPSIIARITMNGARLFLPRSTSAAATSVTFLQVECGLIRASLRQATKVSVDKLSSLVEKILLSADNSPSSLDSALVKLYVRSIVDSADSAVYPALSSPLFEESGSSKSLSACYSSLELSRFFVSELCTISKIELKAQGLKEEGGIEAGLHVESISLTPSLNATLKWAEALASLMKEPFSLREAYIPLAPFTPLSILIDEVRLGVTRRTVDVAHVQCSVNQFDVAIGSDDHSLLITGGSSDSTKQVFTLSVEFAGLPPLISSLLSSNFLDPSNFTSTSLSTTTLSDIQHVLGGRTAPGLFIGCSIGAISSDYENAQRFLDVCADIRVGAVALFGLAQGSFSSKAPIVMDADYSPNDRIVDDKNEDVNAISNSFRRWQNALMYAMPRNICLRTLSVHSASIILSRDISLVLPHILVDTISTGAERNSLLFSFSAETLELWHHIDSARGEEGSRVRKALLSRAEGRFLLRDNATGRIDVSLASSVCIDLDLLLLKSLLTIQPLRVPSALLASRSNVKRDSSPPFTLALAVAVPNFIVALNLCTSFDHHRSSSGIINNDNPPSSSVEVELTALSIATSDASISLKLGAVSVDHKIGKGDCTQILLGGRMIHKNSSSHQQSTSKEWLATVLTLSNSQTQLNEVNTSSNLVPTNRFIDIVLPERSLNVESNKLQCALGDTVIVITPALLSKILSWIETVSSLFSVPLSCIETTHAALRSVSLARSPALSVMAAPLLDLTTGNIAVTIEGNKKSNQNISIKSYGLIVRLQHSHSPSSDSVQLVENCRSLSLLSTGVSIQSSDKVLVGPTDLSLSVLAHATQDVSDFSLSSTLAIETNLPEISVSVSIAELLSMVAIGSSFQDAISYELSAASMARSSSYLSNNLADSSIIAPHPKSTSGYVLESSLTLRLSLNSARFNLLRHSNELSSSSGLISLLVLNSNVSVSQSTSVSMSELEESRGVCISLSGATKSLSASCGGFQARYGASETQILEIPPSTSDNLIISLSSTSSLERLSRRMIESIGSIPDALIVNLVAQVQPITVTLTPAFIASLVRELSTIPASTLPHQSLAVVAWHHRLLEQTRSAGGVQIIDTSSFITVMRLRLTSSLSVRLQSQRNDSISLHLAVGPILLSSSLASLPNVSAEKIVKLALHRKGLFALDDTALLQSTVTLSEASVSLVKSTRVFTLLEPVTAQASVFSRSFFLPLCETSQKASPAIASIAMSHSFASVNIGGSLNFLLDAQRIGLLLSIGIELNNEMTSSTTTSFDSSSHTQSRPLSTVPATPLLTLLPRGLSALDLPHSLSQLPVSVSRSLANDSTTSFSLGASSFPTDALLLSGIGSSSAQSDLAGTSIQVSDTALWVPNSLWERSVTLSSVDRFNRVTSSLQHIGQGTNTDSLRNEDSSSSPFDIHRDWKLTRGRTGAWWGSFSWNYAFPVHLKDVSSSAPVPIPQHTFVESLGGDKRYSSCAEVPATLCCVLDRLERSPSSMSSMNAPCLTTPAEIFVHGWVPVCSFQLSTASSNPAGSESTPFTSNLPLIGLMWHDSPPSTRTVNNTSPNTISDLETFCNSSSSTWRIRWLEPLLTASSTQTNSARGDVSNQKFSHPPYVVVGSAIASVLRFCASWSTSKGTKDPEEEDEKKKRKRKNEEEEVRLVATIPKVSSLVQTPGLRLFVSEKAYFDDDASVSLGSAFVSPSLDVHFGLTVCARQEYVGSFSTIAALTECIAFDVNTGGASQLASRFVLLPDVGVDVASIGSSATRARITAGACSVNLLPQTISSLVDLGSDLHAACARPLDDEHQVRPVEEEKGMVFENLTDLDLVVCQGGIESAGTLIVKKRSTSTWVWPSSDAMLPLLQGGDEDSGITGVRCFRISSTHSPLTWSEPVPVDESLTLKRSDVFENNNNNNDDDDDEKQLTATSPFRASFPRFVWAERVLQTQVSPSSSIESSDSSSATTLCLPVLAIVTDPSQSSSESRVTLRGAVSLCNRLGSKIVIKWKQVLRNEDNGSGLVVNVNDGTMTSKDGRIDEMDNYEEIKSTKEEPKSSTLLGAIGSYFFGDSDSSRTNDIDKSLGDTDDTSEKIIARTIAPVVEISGSIVLEPGESADVSCVAPGPDSSFFLQISSAASPTSSSSLPQQVDVSSELFALPECNTLVSLCLAGMPNDHDAIANDDCNSSPPFTMTALLQVRKEQLRASYLSLSDASSLPPDITVVSIYPWLSVDTNGVTKDIELCSGYFSTPLQTSAVTTPLLLSPKCLPLEHLSLYQGDRNTTSSLSSSISTPKSTPSSPSVAVLTCLVALAKALSEAERRDQINVNNASSRPPPPPSASSSVSSTVLPTVSVALALDAPIKPLLLDSSIQSSLTEVSIEASRAWHLIPIHTIYGGGSSQASLCRTSWHNSTGATLSMRAPLEIINSLDESIDISFALPGDASTNAGGLSTHGFFASVSPGQVLQIFDVPLIATGADGSSCIEAAIALKNPQKCKSLQQNNATNSAYYTSSSLSSKHHVSSKDKLRSTQFLLPLSVNSTAMPLVLAGDGEWCVPLIVKADSSSSSSSSPPSLRWTISPRFVIHSQTKSTLSWSHPNLSRLMDAPATVSGVIHSFTTTQCSTLCVPTVSAMNMIDEPVTAINLSLAGSSLGVICIRLGDPQHENHSKKRSYSTLPTSGSSSSSSSSSPSSLQTHSSSVNNFGRDFQSLRSLLTCPSIPAGYSVRIPLLSGNNRSLQGLLLVRVLLDDLTGATNVIVLDDPQPPVRFVNSSTSSAAVAIRLARAPRLLPEHRLAFQLALCSPLEAVEVLGRMAQEEESLIRAKLLEAADKSSEGSINTNNSSTNGGSGGSSVHGSNNNNSGGVASDLISYGSELALAHAKVALEQVSNEVDEWARAAKNNAPAVLTEHLMWSSQFDVDPSYSVVVGVNESAPFDWSLMVDIGLRTAFSERPFLIPWTPAIPLVWSSSQQQVFMQRPTSSSAIHQTPQIDLEDVSAPQKDGGAKFRLTSSVWRRACANASMIPARVFEGDSPIQHILPNIQIQSLGGVGVQSFVNTDLVLRSSLHSQSSPLASQSSNTTSSTVACDLLDGTLTVYLHDDIGGLIEKGETELETKSSSSFSSSSSSISSTNDKTESNLYSMRVDRISVALLNPEAVPVGIPSSSSLSPENYSWWVPIVPKGTSSSSSPTGVLLPPRFTSSNLAKNSLSSSSSSSCVANPPYALTRHRQLLVLHVFGTSAAVSTSSFPQMACSTSSSLFLGFEHAQLDDHQIPSPSGSSSSENRANDVGSPLRFTVIAMLSPQEDGGIFEQNYALSACIEAVSLPSLGGSFASSGGARGGGLGLSNVSVSLGLVRLQLSDTAADEIIEAYKIWAPLLISKIEVLKEALLTTSIIKTDDTLSDTLSGSEKEKQISRSITFLLPLTMLTLGQLRIAKIAIEVSLCASKPGSGPLFIAVDRMPLAFSAITLKNVISTPEALLRAIVASYIVDTLLRSPALVGSLDLLGNPTNLSRSIAAGLYDVFALPLRGRGGRPGGGRGSVIDVLTGIGLGWASLAGHITEGTLHSIAGLSVSLSRNINRLLSQHHHQHQHQQHHQQLNHNHLSERIGGLNGGSPRRFVDTGRGGREGGEGVQSPGGKIVNQTSMLSSAPVSLPRLHAHSDASASPPSSPTRLTAQTSTGMDPNLQEESSAPSLAVISNTTSSSLSQTKDNALLQRSLSWYSPRPLQSNDEEENQLPLFLCNDDSKVGGIAYLNMNANGASSSFSSFILEGGSKNNNSRVSLLRSVIMRGSMSSSSYSSSSSSSSSSFSSSSSLSSTLVSSTTDSSALVAGIRPSLADGIEGLGRGLLGAVSDLASLSMQAMSSEPSRGTGSVIAEVGRGLASAITKPVAGALELIAHASTAAMLAVQFTPRVAHVSPVEWSQMAMVSPPTPVFLKALSLFGKYKHEEEKDHALIFIPCNVRRVQQQGANHVEQRGSTATGTNASSSSSSSNERAWLIGNAQSHHHQRFVFIRHGGRGSRAFQAINVGQGKRLPDVLSALSNVVSVKEVGNSALLKSAQKGDSISTTTVSFLITLQEEEKGEGKKDTMAPVVVNSSSSSSSISSSLPTSMSPASKLLPSTPVKTSKASSMEAPGSTPINVRSPQNGSTTTPSSTTTSSGFNLNFFSSSSPSLAPLSPLSSAANPLAQSKARDKFDVLVILPVDLRYLFSKIILCNKN